MKKRRYLTLIEIMVVIVLIGLIGGVVAYNVSGSLEEGKAFATKQGASQLGNALMFAVSSGQAKMDDVAEDWQKVLKASPLVKNGGQDLIKDGWNNEYVVTVDVDKDQLTIKSAKYETWWNKKHSNAYAGSLY